MKRKNILKLILQAVIVIVIGYFFIERIYFSWTQLSSYDFRINIFYFVLSLILLFVGFFLVSFGWRKILLKLGEKIGVRRAFNIWAKSEMAKYIPGMVWTAVGRVYLAKKDKTKTILSVLMELGFKVLSALMISILSIYSLIKGVISPYLIALIIVGGLILVHPIIFQRILNLCLVLIKRKKIEIKIRYLSMLTVLSLFILAWLTIGTGFFFMALSMYDLNFGLIFTFIGLFCISWVAGFLFLIMPGGIGIREGVIVLLLQEIIPIPIAIVISLVGRLWWTMGDLMVFLFAKIVYKK